MKLEDIGFYTLEDKRAKNVSSGTPLWRCELILTSRCNFSCPYCRGVDGFEGDLEYNDASEILEKWILGGFMNFVSVVTRKMFVNVLMNVLLLNVYLLKKKLLLVKEL